MTGRNCCGRQEGHFLVSYETARRMDCPQEGTFTEVLGAGSRCQDCGLPLDAAQVLTAIVH
jgi:hypothetical protein